MSETRSFPAAATSPTADLVAKNTRLVVAHRLSTIQNADTIYFLSDGKVSEAGAHQELMSAGGEFSEFAKRQML